MNSIQNKLFLVFTLVATFLVASLVVLMQWSLDKGMIDYVNKKESQALSPVKDALVNIYERENSWVPLFNANRQFDRLLRDSLESSEFKLPPRPYELAKPSHRRDKDRQRPNHRGEQYKRPPPNERHRPKQRQDRDLNLEYRSVPKRNHKVSYAVLDVNKILVVGHYPKNREYYYSPLEIDEKVVGFLAISKRNQLTQGYEFDFVEQQRHYLWIIAIVLLSIILVVTLPLARHIVSPIKSLTRGMHNLTQGNYGKHLSINRTDEFSQLARDYNELASTLAENDNARKRWLANISHELRTPVAILKGELEAIIDGVRPLDMKQIDSAHHEVNHLQRLIEDLHALTSADIGGMSYRKSSLDLAPFLLKECQNLETYLSDASFSFNVEISDEPCWIFGDSTRLCQLLQNLANNCVKYASGGQHVKLSLNIDTVTNQAIICVEDDGIGVENQHLSHLFEHLYRVENSRNRANGGSGLGLSICAHIVQAHQGKIEARKSSLGGLAVYVALPIIDTPKQERM